MITPVHYHSAIEYIKQFEYCDLELCERILKLEEKCWYHFHSYQGEIFELLLLKGKILDLKS